MNRSFPVVQQAGRKYACANVQVCPASKMRSLPAPGVVLETSRVRSGVQKKAVGCSPGSSCPSSGDKGISGGSTVVSLTWLGDH